MSIKKKAEEIHDGISSDSVSLSDVEQQLELHINEYGVPEGEAVRTVRRKFDAESSGNGGGVTEVDVGEISEPENWVTVEVTVADLWNPSSESIAQTGLVGDESGTIKFTSWSKSDLPKLQEGGNYRLENVVTDEFQGRLSIKLNKSTDIEELDREIEAGENKKEITGALVDIQSGSGLIKRCPQENCSRVLQNQRCSEHGKQEGEFDLRIKAVIDDGVEVQDVIMNKEKTEEVTGIGIEEAEQMAKDALDTSIVTDKIEGMMMGRYYRVNGGDVGRYLLAEDVEGMDSEIDMDSVKEIKGVI